MPGFSLRLGLGMLQATGGEPVPPPPSGITLSSSEVETTDTGTVATLLMINGAEPPVFTLLPGSNAAFSIVGSDLIANGSQAAGSATLHIRVTDARGRTFDQDFNITVTAQPIENDSGVSAGDGAIVTPDPNDPQTDQGGFVEPPVQQDTSAGLKITGKNGGSANWFKSLTLPLPGAVVTFSYQVDWSGMTRQGREAAVGFAFKSGNQFHLASIRGNGANPASMRASRVYGDFRKANQMTITDDAAATGTSKDGPNYLRLIVSNDGETYKLFVGAALDSLVEVESGRVPAPIAGVDDALQFGIGGYFTNHDKGVFGITITLYTDAIPQAVGNAAGISTAAAVARPRATAAGSAAGTGAASGIGRAVLASAGTAAGAGAASGAGAAIIGKAGSAAGTSTAAAVAYVPTALVAYANFQLPSATGNFDISTSDLGGLTPKMAVFYLSNAEVSETTFGVAGEEAFHSIGATDGTNQWSVTSCAENGSNGDRRGYSDTVCLHMIDSLATTLLSATFVSFSSGKVTINIGTLGAELYLKRGFVQFFAGSDCSVDVGVIQGETDGTTTKTLGITPEGMLFSEAWMSAPGVAVSDALQTLGFAINDGSTQYNVGRYRASGTGEARVNNKAAGYNGLGVGGCAIGFSGANITATWSTATELDLPYAAWSFGGHLTAKSGTLSSPTSPGNVSASGLGITPTSALFLTGAGGTINTSYSGGGFGAGWLNGSAGGSIGCQSTSGYCSTTRLNIAAGADLASLSSFASGQLTLNFTTADATARLIPFIAFGT